MIRQVTTRDPVVVELLGELSESYVATYGASDVEPSDLDAVIVAYDGPTPVGLIGWKQVGLTKAHVRRLYVRPEARGRGWAERLVSAVSSHAKAAGFLEGVYDAEVGSAACLLGERNGGRLVPSALPVHGPSTRAIGQL